MSDNSESWLPNRGFLATTARIRSEATTLAALQQMVTTPLAAQLEHVNKLAKLRRTDGPHEQARQVLTDCSNKIQSVLNPAIVQNTRQDEAPEPVSSPGFSS